MSRRWWPWFRCSHCGLRRKWRHDRTVEHPPPPYLLRQLTGAPIIDFDVDTITVRLVDTELGRCDTCGGSGLEGYEGSGFGECPDCIKGFRPVVTRSAGEDDQ